MSAGRRVRSVPRSRGGGGTLRTSTRRPADPAGGPSAAGGLPALIRGLSSPGAYPHPADPVEVRQTHISCVFLAGPFAYKIKKPVDLGFLDFTTLDRRRHFCEEEVRLNRRLARDVYLGIVPVTAEDGLVRIAGRGEAIEYAVQMVRLPDEAALIERIRRGEALSEAIVAVARRIAEFHGRAGASPAIARFGRFEAVAGNARENFLQARPHVGRTVEPAIFDRMEALTEASLDRLRPLIEGRAAAGVPRDTHGDLHLDHVYLFPANPAPRDIVIIDCIEFNERFRYADPIADMAFLAMDLAFSGRRDLATLFSDAYIEARGDEEGRALLPFYAAYRAVVRAKVEAFVAGQPEVPDAEREGALARSRAHWLLAAGLLEEPARRPCLVLVGGLPGTGKSTLARGLAERGGFEVVRSDVVRKELAGFAPSERASARFEGGIYAPAATDRTYAECLARAGGLLRRGRRVIVDASFREDRRREEFLREARRLAVPAILLICEADPAVVGRRLRARRGDASDADAAVYAKARGLWEGPSDATREATHAVDAGGSPIEVLDAATRVLEKMGVL